MDAKNCEIGLSTEPPSLFHLNRQRIAIRYNEVNVFLLSVPANLTLILLLLTERNYVLRAYANVLLQNCATDIAYTLVLLVIQPVEMPRS